jgi:hypothetical protein
MVALGGLVVAIDRETEPKPPSGRAAVWYELDIEAGEEDAETGEISPHPILALVEAVPFELEDSSGERARVLPARGSLALGERSPRMVRAEGELLNRLHDLLLAHNKAVDGRMVLFYSEIVLAPGDSIIVQGMVRREELPVPYRTGPRTMPILSADGGDLVVWRVGNEAGAKEARSSLS